MCSVNGASDDMIVHDLPHDGAVCIDDVLAWKRSIAGLQRFVDKLLPLLLHYGLVVQPAKCKLVCLKGFRARLLILEGKELSPVPPEEVLMIMNLPVGFESTEQSLLEAMVDKAR